MGWGSRLPTGYYFNLFLRLIAQIARSCNFSFTHNYPLIRINCLIAKLLQEILSKPFSHTHTATFESLLDLFIFWLHCFLTLLQNSLRNLKVQHYFYFWSCGKKGPLSLLIGPARNKLLPNCSVNTVCSLFITLYHKAMDLIGFIWNAAWVFFNYSVFCAESYQFPNWKLQLELWE